MLRNENGVNKFKISLLLVYASSCTSSKGSCNLNHETSDVMTYLCWDSSTCITYSTGGSTLVPIFDNITRHLINIYFMHKAHNNITIKNILKSINDNNSKNHNNIIFL